MPGMDLFGAEERKEVMDVLETTCLFRYNHEHLRDDMWKARELEHEIKQFTGAPYAHVVSSGSTAVTSCMAAAGVGLGAEVIVTPFTYVAPIEAVLWGGGLPIFADIDETLNLTAESIEAALTPKTKAVLLVHMCGAPGNMDEIVAVCEKHNLALIEDCGQAFGSFYKGKSVGLFGKAGAFSMDFFKITTAGEGGICITNDEATYHTLEQVSDHGHTHVGDNRGMEDHPIIGGNFRLGELNAAVGLAQTRKVEKIRAANLKNKAYLKSRLSAIDGITFRHLHDPEGDSGTFLNFFLPNQETAERVHKQLAADGVGGFNYWFTNMYHFINQWDHIKELKAPVKLAVHHFGAPQDYKTMELPGAQEVIGRLISLGIKANWTEQELEQFADAMINSIKKAL